MLKFVVALLCLAPFVRAEDHPLTLQQALAIAARQNPDVALARLDEQRAVAGIKVALDPFRPKVYAGSGLAKTYGYPMSVDGNAPSIVQVKGDMDLLNRSKNYEVASARETARGSQFGAQAKAEEVAYQAADLFLTASAIQHEGETLRQQLPSLHKVSDAMDAAVSDGSELPLESKRAKLNLDVSVERLSETELDLDYYEMMLAVVLGYPATDRVKPVESDLSAMPALASADDAADMAIRNNRELRKMQSAVLSKELEIKSYRAARLPQVKLIAQYALFSHFNNYELYIPNFQYNNFEIGGSIQIPILVGSAAGGMMEQAATDMAKMRIQTDQTRNRIITSTRRSYDVWKKSESIRDLARAQLDFAREELTVLLAKQGECRAPMSEVERARLAESDKWIALYDAETQVTRARLNILRETGTLLATLGTGSLTPAP